MKPAFLKAGLGCSIFAVLSGATLGVWSCGTAQTPIFVSGPGISGDEPPEMTILVPSDNLTRGQGEFFRIEWTDRDPDSNAQIRFALVNIANSSNSARVALAGPFDENDATGPDSVSIGTSLVPVGNYNLVATISDGVNTDVDVFALTNDAVPQRVILTIVGPGEGSPTVPPTIVVIEPAINRRVTQDDDLLVLVQPTELDPDVTRPYDPDSDVTIFILLDLDLDPNNDDPATPDPSKIILLDSRDVDANAFNAEGFARQIDLAQIPPRPGGQPYFVRATIDDGTNPRVHQYAVGTISVVQLAAGLVDLFDVGRDVSGARVTGFGPGANLGSAISALGDFDADGVDDFGIVARFGNPRNFGRVGEAYLMYGADQIRFGGDIAANSIGEAVPGVIMEAPPVRDDPLMPDSFRCIIPDPSESQGITAIGSIRDISGDGRPEILVGLKFVHGAFDGMDYDPGDQPVGGNANDEDTTDIEVVIRQGEVRVVDPDNGSTTTTYLGVIDGTIDSGDPTATLNSADALAWQDEGPDQRKWSLIKFENVLDEIPDTLFGQDSFLDVSTVDAKLELRVFTVGGQGDVFQVVSEFSGQTTYADFAVGGGDPQLDVDYIRAPGGTGDGKLGSVDGGTPETVTVDVTPVVQSLLNGGLFFQDDELRFIIVHDGEVGGEAGARTSEFALGTERPVLRIEYERVNLGGASGCYPDDLVNNFSDDVNEDQFDQQYYAGGMAVLIDSSNRDNRPRSPDVPERLENTVITLELVGQQSQRLSDEGVNEAGGGIAPRADDYAQLDRIAGARFIAGPFDCVNDSNLNQPPRTGFFGQDVASIGDLNNDDLDEIIISAPRNERYIADLESSFGPTSSHLVSSLYKGSIVVMPGADYNDQFWRELTDADNSNSIIPSLDQQHFAPFGNCIPGAARALFGPTDAFEIFAENIDDRLGGASSAGDFNQDGLDDILCGAPLNDRSTSQVATGAAYILYGRNVLGDFRLENANADDEDLRPPMLRIRGEQPNDQIGWRQSSGLDVNGDRVDDVFISSPRADFGDVPRSTCAGDFNRDGVIDETDLSRTTFSNCQSDHPDGVFSDEACKVFDYDNDGDIGDDDRDVFFGCVADGGSDCCKNLVDNGFVGVIFGGVHVTGDRSILQIATPDLPGVVFFGASTGHRAGLDVSSAGDFNQDGFGDILISVPGETRLDSAGRRRLGVVYLVFGGTHLINTRWSLDKVGTEDLPGIVFVSPYQKGRPNEAAPEVVAFIGDINRDGFGDICIGNPKADFIDLNFPQGPDATDAAVGRRSDAGDAYIIYGNNFGANRGGGS